MFRSSRKHVYAFTLIELAIVLGITGLLFTGLWRLLSTGNQQMRDQATAAQMQQYISAVNAFLSDSTTVSNLIGANNFTANGVGVAPNNVVDITALVPLPPGFSGTNPYGQAYDVQLKKDGAAANQDPRTFSYMVFTTNGDNINDASGGRISANIGGDGGFIYNNDVCTNAGVPSPSNITSCGSYGGWQLAITGPLPANFAIPAGGGPGHIATRSYTSTAASGAQQAANQAGNFLWRVLNLADPNVIPRASNTMTVPMYMNPNLSINFMPAAGGIAGPAAAGLSMNANPIAMQGGTINMNALPADLVGGGNINMANGVINLVNGSMTGGGSMFLAVPTPSILLDTGIKNDNTNTSLIVLNSHCSKDVSLSLNGNTTPDPACNAALQVSGDEFVSGRLNANSLYAQTFIYFGSDRRLKRDIHPIKSPLQDIMKLDPIEYTLKKSGEHGLGVVAQDLEKVYPELVSEGANGLKAVNYNGLIAPLIGAVQELKKENDELKAELQKQSDKTRMLDERISRQ